MFKRFIDIKDAKPSTYTQTTTANTKPIKNKVFML